MERYRRTTELPPKEDRFERFYIRYSVEYVEIRDVYVDRPIENKAVVVDAEVWEVNGWTPDGKPILSAYPTKGKDDDPATIEPLFDIRIKWDGCTHLSVPQLHFDDLEEFDAFTRCIKYLYNDVCIREDCTD